MAKFTLSRRIIALSLLVLLALAGAIVWGYLRHERAQTKKEAAYHAAVAPRVTDDTIDYPTPQAVPKAVEVRLVTAQDTPRIERAPAEVVSPVGKRTPIYAPMAGRIVALNVSVGQKVEKGQILAKFVSASFAQYWSDWQKAQAVWNFARKNLSRSQLVAQSGGKSVKDLQQAQSDFAQADAEKNRARNQLLATGLPQADLNALTPPVQDAIIAIAAPYAGIVGDLNIAPEQYINDPNQVLMNIVPDGSLWVEAQISQSLAKYLAQSDAPEISGRVTGTDCKGAPIAREPSLDLATRRQSLYFACNAPFLRQGSFLTVDIETPEHGVLSVPKSALVMVNDTVFVFVETEPAHFKKKAIRIDYDEGDDVRVLSGLSSGEAVVSSGAIILNSLLSA